jgi:hypothetical protein
MRVTDAPLRLIGPVAALLAVGELPAQSATRSTRGDTTVVTTRGPGRWGPIRDAVEVLRVVEVSNETTFGDVNLIAPTHDGGVLLFDNKAAEGVIIRQFDANGKFVRNIGRRGGGPGEYNTIGTVVFAAAPDGTIIVRDGRRMVNRYGPDGKFLDGFAHGYASTLELYIASNGDIIMRGPFERGAAPMAFPPLIRHAPSGKVLDTIKGPAPWYRGPTATMYDPANYWIPFSDGRIVQFRSDKVGFLLVDPRARTKPVMAEVASTPVGYLPAERAELERLEDWKRRASANLQVGEVPRLKPLVRNYGFVDFAQRIWILRAATAQRSRPQVAARARGDSVIVTYAEPRVFSVFEPSGTYLGDVRFPVGVAPAVVADYAWAIVRDADEAPVLVKYRVGR